MRDSRARAKAGWTLVAACLTRYEAWFVTAAVLALAAIALWRAGRSMSDALKSTAQLAIYPVLAIVGFFFHSWFTIGEWFVTGGFFVPDNIAYRTPVYGGHGGHVRHAHADRHAVGSDRARRRDRVVVARPLEARSRGLTRGARAGAFMVLPAYAFYQGIRFACAT